MKKYTLKRRIILELISIALWSTFTMIVLIMHMVYDSFAQDPVKIFLLGVILLWLAVMIVLGKIKIYEPIVKIRKKIDFFNEGIIFEEVFDSLHGISDETDTMFIRLEELLDKDKRIENAKQQARYLALQNQINPHFLYNVLESIRSDALIAGAPEIAKVTEALSVFFRYTTSKMENLSTLQEEMANVETYFMIQKYRFEDKISLKIKYPEEDENILKAPIPKLTLQPLVENAIRHGLEPQIEGGTVEIKIECTDKNLYISVADDGIGIDEDKLALMNEKLVRVDFSEESVHESGKGGIALLNVNTRIRLLMGEEYGIHVFSTPGIGTEIRMTLPNRSEQA